MTHYQYKGRKMHHDPLHGVKLAEILTLLEKKLGWKIMGETLNINCFINHPHLKSSLTFLRKTPWARTKVEILYLKTFHAHHPATKKLVRNLIEQKKNNTPQKAPEADTFNWPNLKNK